MTGRLTTKTWTSKEIRALREFLRLYQEGFARLVGVDVNTVSKWETGLREPTLPNKAELDRIAGESGFKA